MPSTFEQNLTKIVNDTKACKAEYAKMPAAVKSKDNNYRNAVAMVFDAQDAITKLKAEIKKGDAKAVEEMKKWQPNYPKIFARIKPCMDEIVTLKKALSDLGADVDKAKKTADQLNKDAARSAMSDVKTAATQLKTVLADLKSVSDGIDKQVELLSSVPKEPNGVFV
jgi:chromosome segregation ATPase